ncbi:MAG TPA: type I restriction-modification enzyme R subunit C-terminal domain-containing protein [Thermoanaerobaculia bacterium]|nr:type I restriction-modification enzyme R subunit C-terminal domain-containing protein [Thermoanaerobaculia bacterium]
MSENLLPEQRARQLIDQQLAAGGWAVQNRGHANLGSARGVAIREFKLTPGHGFVDYLLFVDRRPVGLLEAKPAGHTLTGVEGQARIYSRGLPQGLIAPVEPLPFVYLSTGAVTRFTNLLDPHPRSREIFQVHRPDTLAEWLQADPLALWANWSEAAEGVEDPRPSSLRGRLQHLPGVYVPNLWQNKVKALERLEASLREDRPRALIQMATGSGKTRLAVTSIYRLIKYGGARRVLFLVDRSNLGEQADKEFQGFRTPDDNRLFTELYNVQLLASNTIAPSSKVVITTIQRLYSILKGEPELDPAEEEGSLFERSGLDVREPLPVVYNAALPPEFFDVVFVDECHRSIYSIWRQVLEYFDAYLIGLTATPAKHTYGFFKQNVVMEYSHEEAVADGVNVDFEVYRIRTRITKEGSTIEASPLPVMGLRDKRTRTLRWESPDEDVTYAGSDLDRKVVARDQIRLIVKTFREKLFTEIFPGRAHVPKTLIFAKDDSHAEDIVDVVREEFGRGNEFCQKITYKSTGKKAKDLIQDFRTSYNPRIAVTVDMIATGTDVRPIEIVMFMRSVKSRVLFEQMKGRGVRTVDRDELRGVTPDAAAKTHFVIVDCVEITESDLADTQPLERKPTVSLASLLEQVSYDSVDPEVYSSLLSRLSRLDRQLDGDQHQRVRDVADGAGLGDLTRALAQALDPDRQLVAARERLGLGEGDEVPVNELETSRTELLHQAARPLADNRDLRELLMVLKTEVEQIIDEVSQDELLEAGASEAAREKARALVRSFETYLAEHRDEIEALDFFYSVPHARRLRYDDLKALAAAIGSPPRSWTPETLWRAYQTLERDKVRGASAQRLLTDIVSLVRFALRQDDELVPFPERVDGRFDEWLAQQETAGRAFTGEQRRWLTMMRDHIATSLAMELDDFGLTPFAEEGGLGRARRVFGEELGVIVKELNEVLAA